jgi:transposase
MYDDWSPSLHAHKTFANTEKGFTALLLWLEKLKDPSTAVRFVMEATGVYHERLAYFLESKDYEVSIVLPNKISNYFRTLAVKTITDRTSSARTAAKNQLHAEQAEAEPNKSSVARMKKQIVFFDKQEQEIKTEIKELSGQDQKVKETINTIESIPGVGLLTAVTVLAETNGFELIRNKRQLTSYAGLDVKEKQSGTSVKGRPRISKKGNKYLRKAMHLPALAAIRSDERFKAIFTRLVSKHGIKMKAAVAVQRKLLELIYIIYKTKKLYDKEYLKKSGSNKMAVILQFNNIDTFNNKIQVVFSGKCQAPGTKNPTILKS